MTFAEAPCVPESSRFTLILAAGFEDRSTAYLTACRTQGIRFGQVVVVEYEPFDPKNRLEATVALAEGVSVASPKVIRFSRFDPDSSEDCSAVALGQIAHGQPCVLDVSGMSKFLIVILVARLVRLGILSYVVYTEPLVYRPTQDEYANSAQASDERLVFQTTGLYGLTTVRDLTTATMQGYPQLLVASPTFEPAFMRALINELTPARLVLLEGEPPSTRNAWRREAVRNLNSGAFRIAESNILTIPTNSIDKARDALQKIYLQHRYSHRLVVAPAASKLNSIGLGIALSHNVEAECVYPTPLGFSDPYSDGIGSTSVFAMLPDLDGPDLVGGA